MYMLQVDTDNRHILNGKWYICLGNKCTNFFSNENCQLLNVHRWKIDRLELAVSVRNDLFN